MAVGSIAMVVTATQPLMLFLASTSGRATEGGAHWASLLELLAMGISVALCGSLLPPRRLRLTGALAGAAYAALCLLSAFTTGDEIVAVRVAAGLCSGVLIWITIGMLARLEHPEPWAAGFFVTQAVAGLVVAGLALAVVLPGYGLTVGLLYLAGVAALAIPAALLLAPEYPTLEGRWPSGRGLIGLLAVFLFVAAGAGVWFHMNDFLAAAGHRAMGGTMIVATLIGQFIGAGVAIWTAGRVRFVWVFVGVCAITLAAWAVIAGHPPAIGFQLAFGVAGFASMVLGTWLFSFLGQADPTRRAAAVSAAAQLAGAALGPMLPDGLWVNAGLVVVSLVLVLWLQRAMPLGARLP